MRVRLLGPVDVMSGDEVRPLSGLRRKAVLATLALQAGEVVSTGRLVDAVWGEAAPAARNTLQSHVSYLRTVLGKAAIVAHPPGYLLDLGEDGTDVHLAERLLRQGAQSADPGRAAADLREALALWRGRPLADLAGLAWLEQQAERLDLLRERIRHALSEARLDAGEHRQLIPELEQMAADHPLDEQIHAQLMTALYRSGRQADALAVYQRLRATLADELGLDAQPGAARARDRHPAAGRGTGRIRAGGEPARGRAAAASGAGPGAAAAAGGGIRRPRRGAGPARRDPGRPGGPRRLRRHHLGDHRHRRGGQDGPGGALGTRVAARFPGGQLYVDLRGFGPAGAALDPGQALRGFFEAFAVPPERIPGRPGRPGGAVPQPARQASGCSWCSITRVTPGRCARCCPARLDAWPSSPAEQPPHRPDRRARRAPAGPGPAHPGGGARADGPPGRRPAGPPADRNAVDEIIAGCARLPLALTIAAARAATSPGFPLAVFAADLRETGHALDPFGGDDVATDIRAVFSWSYRSLSPDTARMFRLLGLYPGPDITVCGAASLAGIAPDRARALLAELTRGHLLSEHRPGRYAFHDLLRAYASEQARDRDDDGARRAGRAGSSITGCTPRAPGRRCSIRSSPRNPPDRRCRGYSSARPPPPRRRCGGSPPSTPRYGDLPLAARSGLAGHAWRLAWALSIFLLRRGCWEEQARACQAALDAARPAGDVAGEAPALLLLALGDARSGRRDASPAFPRVAAAAQRGRGLPPQPGDRAQQPDLDRRAAGALRGHARSRRAGPRAVRGRRRPDPGDHEPQRCRLQPRAARELRTGRRLLRAGARRQPGRRGTKLGVRRLGQPRLHPPQARRSPARHHLLRTVARPVPGARRPVQRGGHARSSRRRPSRRGRRARGPLGVDSGAAHARRLGHPDGNRVRAKMRVPDNRLPAVI